MSWWLPHNFEKKRSFLEKRSLIIKTLRSFFDDQNFTAVETPILQACPAMDAHIHGFKTQMQNIDLSYERDLYLHTSPEFDMKKLLVAGMPKIYQICHVFRNGEESKLHSPEFTLLEWYRAGEDYKILMDDCINLLRRVADIMDIDSYMCNDIVSNPYKEWEVISVCDAFIKYSDIDLSLYLTDLPAFYEAAHRKGIRVIESDNWGDIFHAVMAQKIEPYLGVGAPAILYDYPISMAALSRKKPEDERLAERFELYVCGVELANAFSELTDAVEQRARYDTEMKLKQELYGEVYPADEEFFKALEYGMPESAGIALGVDRLVMLATGAKNINDVLWAQIQ